jgi:hypothetical protein
MTARQPPNPGGLNNYGTGRGKKLVTKPITKKRGASTDRTKHIAANREKYVGAANIPVAQIAETIDPNKPLTEKAKLFVKFWAQGESISSAAIKAGYGDGASYAYRLVHFPQAKALYAEEKRLYEEASQMTRKQVMDGLLDGIDMAKLMADPGNVIAGWREIGKLCGYYEPIKKNINLTVNGSIALTKLQGMSDTELLDLLAQRTPELIEDATKDDGDED